MNCAPLTLIPGGIRITTSVESVVLVYMKMLTGLGEAFASSLGRLRYPVETLVLHLHTGSPMMDREGPHLGDAHECSTLKD